MKRQTILVAVVGTVVVLAAWYLLLWGPKTHDLAAAQKEKVVAERASTDATLKLARLTTTNAHKDELFATKARLTSLVPATSDLPTIVDQINDAAAAAGLGFLSITPTLPTNPLVAGGPNNVPLSLTISGSYGPILDFMNRLAALDRYITVDGISFKPKVDGLTVSSIDVALTARAFTTEPVAVKGAASPSTASAPAAPAASSGAAK